MTLAADVALYHCAALAVRGASQDGCWKSLQGSLLDLQDGMGGILVKAASWRSTSKPVVSFFFSRRWG